MRLRLIASFVLIVLIAIGGVVLFVRTDSAQQVTNYMLRGGMVGADQLVEQLQDYYQQNGSWVGVDTLLSAGHGMGMGGMGRRGMMGQRIQLADTSGLVVADSDNLSTGATLSAQERDGAIVLQDDRKQKIGYLLVAGGASFRAGDELPLISRLNDAALRAGLIGLGIAILLAVVISTSLVRPVTRLTQAAGKLSAGDLAQRVAVSGTDELAALGQAFNHMAESLQAAEKQKRAMTADIAHELRTPLAVQRAQVEAMQDGVYPLTTDSLRVVLEQNELLSRLVDDLRTLTLADDGELRLEKTDVDLAVLLQRAVERFMPSARENGVTLSLDLTAGCPVVNADPDRLMQILNNTLSNALRHTPTGGEVTLRLTCDGQRVWVRVEDTGEGIPVDSLEHVFDRFYRADRSRSRAQGGTGLGLTIARQLAVLHGGELRAANRPNGGAVFTLELPLGS